MSHTASSQCSIWLSLQIPSFLFLWFILTAKVCSTIGLKPIYHAGFVPATRVVVPPRSASLSAAIAGIQPSGDLHIGNYIGCIKPAVEYQDDRGDLTLLIADLHATTGRETNQDLGDVTRRTVATVLACGIDPEKTNVILQSDMPEILQLNWILGTVISLGRMRKLANFDRRDLAQEKDSVAECLYPLLMAADVLCSGSDTIIAGVDQTSHAHVIREVAEKLNRRLASPIIPMPNLHVNSGFKVMSLDGEGKMSKSSKKQSSRIHLTDTDEEIYEKLRKAKTSTTADASSPEVANLIRLLNFFSGDVQSTISEMQFSVLKDHLHQATCIYLSPIRQRYYKLISDDTAVQAALRAGHRRMQPVFASILERVKRSLKYYI
ncbi:tryptophanyl-tRNA synthetase [Babesia ovis]|uniref:tryptophan--tRNA ligase n=1 Tax=Babesia ovis TaxID=5869 RepID=A0A9W5T914_BABOV|nr:tryptophanyl-tRNA synthetase [Babesia ovis]